MVFGKSLAILFVIFCSVSYAEPDNDFQRKQKLLSLFSVVTFPNNQCTGASASSSQTVLGTCFSSTECTNKAGKADGNCASGFGVCCVFTITTCGATVSNNCSYIQNPNYPSSESSGDCSFNISPLNADVCQLRLDFDNFDITEAAPIVGTCVDSFDVTSGSSRDYFALCGTLTGQHMYVETGRATTDHVAKFTIGTTSTVATWRIKVNQIECSSTSKAPTDCFQYLTGISGGIKSLNYPTTALTDLLYTICVRRDYGYCGIEWSESAITSPDPFDLNTGAVADALVLGLTASASAVYLSIPGSANSLYGGLAFNDDAATIAAIVDETSSSVQAYGMPFTLGVNSYGVADAAVMGFNLVYNQLPCGGSTHMRISAAAG